MTFLPFSEIPGSLNQTPPLSKRPKPNPPAVHSQQQQGVLPNGNGSAPHIQNQLSHNPPQAEPIVIPVEESMALRQEVATLTEDQQQHVVNIMFKNNESLVEDKHGYTEIDLGICRPSTVREIQAYIQSLRAPPPPPPPPQQQQPPPPSHQSSSVIQSLKQVRKPNVQSKKSSSGSRSNSPVKAPKEQNGRLSDSSSDSSDDDDDDTSSGSSSSDSDSE